MAVLPPVVMEQPVFGGGGWKSTRTHGAGAAWALFFGPLSLFGVALVAAFSNSHWRHMRRLMLASTSRR